MEFTELLARTPSPHPRESVLGYSLRLSESNGYATPGYFLASNANQLQISRYRLIDRVRAATGLSEEQLDRLRHSRTEVEDAQYGFLLGQRVSLYDLNLKCPRICPLCVQENGHIEALWDLAWVSVCPIHAVELVSSCLQCKEQLTWSRLGMLKCKRGHALGVSTMRPAGEAHIRVATLLGRKLYGADFGSREVNTDRIDGLTLYDICRIAGKLGNHVANQQRCTKNLCRGRFKLASQDEVVQAIADLLCGTAEECHALFDRISIDGGSGNRHRSFHVAFKWLLDVFPKERAAEQMPSILTLLFAYGAEHWPDCRLQRTSANFSEFVQSSKWMSITAAAKALGIVDVNLREAVLSGEVPGKRVSDKSNHNYIVPVEWVNGQLEVPLVRLSEAQIEHRFRLSTAILRTLVEQGHFVPNIRARNTRFLERDVQNLADRICANAAAEVTDVGPGQITFDELMSRHNSKAAKASFIASILEGKSSPVARLKSAGLSGLIFERGGATRQLLLGEVDMQLEEVKFVLDCHCAKSLQSAGHLQISTIRNGRTYFATSSVLEFDRKFCSARRFLEEAEVRIATLRRVARQAGIEMMGVKEHYRDGLMWFVPRAHAEALRNAIGTFRDVYPPRRRPR